MSLLNYLQYFAERKDKARERELQDSANQWLSGYDGAKTPEERQQALAGINTAVPDITVAAKLQDFIFKRDQALTENKQRQGINQTFEELSKGKQTGGPLREGFEPLGFQDYTMPESLKMFSKYGPAGVEQFDKFAGASQTAGDAKRLADFRTATASQPYSRESVTALRQQFPTLVKQYDYGADLPEVPKPITGNYTDARGNYTIYSANPITGERNQMRLGSARDQKPTTTVSVNVGEKGMTKLAEKMSESIVSRRPDVLDAANGLQTISQAEKLLNDGIITGSGANYRLNAGKALQRAGIHLDDDAISNTETYVALMGKEVGSLIRMFGSGTGLSDADRMYAEKIAGGNISVNEQSLRKIIAINKRARINLIGSYNREARQAMGKPGAEQLPYDLTVPFEQDHEGGEVGKEQDLQAAARRELERRRTK